MQKLRETFLWLVLVMGLHRERRGAGGGRWDVCSTARTAGDVRAELPKLAHTTALPAGV